MCIAAAGLIGGLVSAAGALANSSAQSAQLNAQAKFAERQAEIERERGRVDAARQDRAGAKAFGGSLAQFAKSGVTLSGSPTTVLSNVATENELDTDRVRLSSRAREDQLRFNAGLNRAQAGAARTRGIFGALSPIISSLGG